jgi:dihydroceramidase
MVVGVGSAFFHATLRFEHQMLDELPMLYLAIVMTYVLIENQRDRRWGRWFPITLGLHAMLVTYLCAFTRGQLQFSLFHASFGSLELFALYRIYRLAHSSVSVVVRRLFRYGIASYALAVACWFTDLEACSKLSSLELHAVWHVLVSMGMYLFLTLLTFHDALLEKKSPRLALKWGFVPCVDVSGDPPVFI